jgi:hypothetical protein
MYYFNKTVVLTIIRMNGRQHFMGIVRPVERAVLVAGILYAEPEAADRALSMLEDRFGPLALKSDTFAFTMTDYYTQEMGSALTKYFCCFQQPVDPGILPAVKHASNDIESEFAEHLETGFHRRVNIDPGYVTTAKLVLASTKDYSHRIYIGNSIYGEVTLRCTGGLLRPIDTTYPDYATNLALDFFNEVRTYVKRNRTTWNSQRE